MYKTQLQAAFVLDPVWDFVLNLKRKSKYDRDYLAWYKEIYAMSFFECLCSFSPQAPINQDMVIKEMDNRVLRNGITQAPNALKRYYAKKYGWSIMKNYESGKFTLVLNETPPDEGYFAQIFYLDFREDFEEKAASKGSYNKWFADYAQLRFPYHGSVASEYLAELFGPWPEYGGNYNNAGKWQADIRFLPCHCEYFRKIVDIIRGPLQVARLMKLYCYAVLKGALNLQARRQRIFLTPPMTEESSWGCSLVQSVIVFMQEYVRHQVLSANDGVNDLPEIILTIHDTNTGDERHYRRIANGTWEFATKPVLYDLAVATDLLTADAESLWEYVIDLVNARHYAAICGTNESP